MHVTKVWEIKKVRWKNQMFSNSATLIYFSRFGRGAIRPTFSSILFIASSSPHHFFFSIDIIIALRTETTTTKDERRRRNGKAPLLSTMIISCLQLTNAFYIFHFSFDFRSATTIRTTITMTTTLMTTRPQPHVAHKGCF
jgi:hypothetical protein